VLVALTTVASINVIRNAGRKSFPRERLANRINHAILSSVL
jgi:hypothetical protein